MQDLIAPEYRTQFDEYLKRIQQNGKDQGLLAVITRSGEQRISDYRNMLRTEARSGAEPFQAALGQDESGCN